MHSDSEEFYKILTKIKEKNMQNYLNEIEQLKGKIKEIENKIESELQNKNTTKKLTGWERQEINGKYFCFSNCIEESFEECEPFDDACYNIADYFSTKEKAKEVDKKQELWRKLQRFADENNECELDWRNENQRKWHIECDYSSKKLKPVCNLNIMYFGQVYFSSIEITKKAMETFKFELEEHYGIKEVSCNG